MDVLGSRRSYRQQAGKTRAEKGKKKSGVSPTGENAATPHSGDVTAVKSQ
ncbi:MAG: hypothetical protein AAF517_04435 [Planctomycetota bacterium]